MNGCVIGNQEKATLSPKMAQTIKSRETGGVLELSWRNDQMINHLSEHMRRLQSQHPLGLLKNLKMLLEVEEGVVKAITHLPPEAGTMGGDPASNL